MSEGRVLRNIFAPKKEEVEGGWRKVHEFVRLPNIIEVIKLRGWDWGGLMWHVQGRREAKTDLRRNRKVEEWNKG
jgi:hypothetical protein